MTIEDEQHFWQKVYVSATRAGHNHTSAVERADNALHAFRKRFP